MTVDEMLNQLIAFRPKAEAINVALADMHMPNEEHRWDNSWVAYLTAGKLVTDIIMLANLLQRMHAEGKE